jgi:hypothetical protein
MRSVALRGRLGETPGRERARPVDSRAEPGAARPPAASRTVAAAPDPSAGTSGRVAEPVRALRLCGAVVPPGQLSPPGPDEGARSAAGRAGHADAGHHPHRLCRRLSPLRRGDQKEPPGMVAPSPAAPGRGPGHGRGGQTPACVSRRGASPPGGAREASGGGRLPLDGVVGGRTVGRSGSSPAVGHLGTASRGSLRPRRCLARPIQCHRGGRAEAPRPPIPGRLRPGPAERRGELGRPAGDHPSGRGRGDDAPPLP